MSKNKSARNLEMNYGVLFSSENKVYMMDSNKKFAKDMVANHEES